MNSYAINSVKRKAFREAATLRSKLLVKFPFLPLLPSNETTNDQDFVSDMIGLCQWEKKCANALTNHARHLSLCGHDEHKIKSAIEAIKEFRLPVQLKARVSGRHYYTLMESLHQLGLYKYAY